MNDIMRRRAGSIDYPPALFVSLLFLSKSRSTETSRELQFARTFARFTPCLIVKCPKDYLHVPLGLHRFEQHCELLVQAEPVAPHPPPPPARNEATAL